MDFLLALPIFLSSLLLAAHFLRGDHTFFLLLALLAPALLLVPRGWAKRLLQLLLLGGAVEWLRAAGLILLERLAAGQPYFRMLLILGLVALVTGGSALLLELPRFRRRFVPVTSLPPP